MESPPLTGEIPVRLRIAADVSGSVSITRGGENRQQTGRSAQVIRGMIAT